MRKRIQVWLTLSAALMGASTCGPDGPELVPEVVALTRASLPTDPGDAAWEDVPLHVAPMLPQDVVEPRLLEASTAEVQVRAITDGVRVAFRLDWADPTTDDLPGPGLFPDACAIQMPVTVQTDVPDPQMGQDGRPVEITFWRASWQATVDGRGDAITDLYPFATVDHYPFEAPSLDAGAQARQAMADRYAPARALGNAMAGPRDRPVEDLLAEGPGTLSPGEPTGSDGRGRRTESGWAVVISRRLPEGLESGDRGQVAFAVWEGSQDEVGSRKMRTVWISLAVEEGS